MANEKISEMGAASALTGAELVEVVQGGANKKATTQDIADLGGGGAGYLVYTALLSQTGTDAPVATVLGDNTIGNIVWTRVGVGAYTGTLAGAFVSGKTYLSIGVPNTADVFTFASLRRLGENEIELTLGDGTQLLDEYLPTTPLPIKIEIYP
jgi:hypothetical protein